MPDLRSSAVGSAAWLAGLPWRLKPGRGKPIQPNDPRLQRVVLIKPCCMGDVLMSTPAIAALRKALPHAHISVAVGDWSRPALANNPRINDELGITNQELHSRDLARQIKRGSFGTALVLDRSPLLSIAPLQARVPLRAGLDSDNRGIGLTHPVPCPSNRPRHEVEWYLDVVRALGLPAPNEEAFLEFYPTQQDKAQAGQLLSENAGEQGEGGYVAIHLGGGANPGMRLLSKRWQPERWAQIADWLAETYDPTILLLGGPGQEDREAAESLKTALFPSTTPYIVDLVGKLEWGVMAALIQRCGLFLGHDTGAMHLATAVRTPVVAVFGPSDPARYGPWDPSGHSIAVAPPAQSTTAESLRQAAQSGDLYHDAVTPEQVWATVEKVFAPLSQRERAQV